MVASYPEEPGTLVALVASYPGSSSPAGEEPGYEARKMGE